MEGTAERCAQQFDKAVRDGAKGHVLTCCILRPRLFQNYSRLLLPLLALLSSEALVTRLCSVLSPAHRLSSGNPGTARPAPTTSGTADTDGCGSGFWAWAQRPRRNVCLSQDPLWKGRNPSLVCSPKKPTDHCFAVTANHVLLGTWESGHPLFCYFLFRRPFTVLTVQFWRTNCKYPSSCLTYPLMFQDRDESFTNITEDTPEFESFQHQVQNEA